MFTTLINIPIYKSSIDSTLIKEQIMISPYLYSLILNLICIIKSILNYLLVSVSILVMTSIFFFYYYPIGR